MYILVLIKYFTAHHYLNYLYQLKPNVLLLANASKCVLHALHVTRHSNCHVFHIDQKIAVLCKGSHQHRILSRDFPNNAEAPYVLCELCILPV